MSEQTKAQRLADALDCEGHIGMSKAATELRRLVTANAELLEALKESQAVLRAVSKDDPTFQLARYGLQIVRAAIAKHGAPQ